MAPKRKQATPKEEAPAAAAPAVRRSARLSTVTVSVSVSVAEAPKKKKTKTKQAPAPAPSPAKKEVEAEAKPAAEKAETAKTIIIEHCKQCNSFKTRAIQVKEGLEKDVAGVNVVINKEKPRRGCFEIREEGGEVFVSLLDMKRPFPPLKALDMDALISEIVQKIQ